MSTMCAWCVEYHLFPFGNLRFSIIATKHGCGSLVFVR
jgi:hypothetical protein